ncbi:hypothetical protein [Lysobacter sp. HA35]
MEKTSLALVGLFAVLPAFAAGGNSRLSNELFPLSPYYGACLKSTSVSWSSIRSGTYGYASVVDLTAEGAQLNLSVGPFMIEPGSAISELPRSPARARVQAVGAGRSTCLLVSNIPGAGESRVSIHYAVAGKRSRAAALVVANGLVGCRLLGSNE